MRCPKCGGKALVKDTLHTEDNETYRKIECIRATTCGHIFWTIEYEIEYDERLKKEIYECGRMETQRRRIREFNAKKAAIRKEKK